MIPFKRRTRYQIKQNVFLVGGAIVGASLGGIIAEEIGWRWCFLLQVPPSLITLIVGYLELENPGSTLFESIPGAKFRLAFKYVDLFGAATLALVLVTQLVGLSFGGNSFPWCSQLVTSSLVLSVFLLAVFLFIEATTKAVPIIPLRMLNGWQPVVVQIISLLNGVVSYSVSVHTVSMRQQCPAVH